MATRPSLPGVLQRVLLDSLSKLSDQQLLDRFAESGDEAVFAAILDRHGPMLLDLCRRLVGERLADDVLQATFLVLARKARSIHRRDSLVNWLYGVAQRLARQARLTEAARRRREQQVATERGQATNSDPGWDELLRVLDEELQRLPARYRSPLLLCYLEGLTQDEAAKQLGWSLSTLRRQLERGRDLLRARMTHRGATLGAALFAGLLAPSVARAILTAELRQATLTTALAGVRGTAVSASILVIANGGMRMTTLTKASILSALVLALSGVFAGVGWMMGRATEAENPPGQPRAGLSSRLADARPGEAPKAPVAGRDRFNDPLPKGALARLGTVEFRHGGPSLGRRSLTFTADGKHLVSVGGGWARRWDLATGEADVNLGDGWRSGRLDAVSRYDLLTTDDGKLVCIYRAVPVPGGQGWEWTEYDLTSGKKWRAYRLATSGKELMYPGALCFSPDGKTCAELGRTITLWNTTDGSLLRRVAPKEGRYTAAVFAPDSKTIIVGDDAHTIRVFAVATGKEQKSFGVANVKGAAALAVSPDGKRLAAIGNGDGFLRLWDLAKGTEERALDLPEGELPAGAGSVVFSPDSRTLIAGVRRGIRPEVRSWDVLTGKPGRAWIDPAIGLFLAISPDGKVLATMNDSGVIRLWDLETGKEKRPQEASPCGLEAVCFQPDGKALWTVGNDFTLRKWDAATGRLLATPRQLIASYGMRFVAGDKLLSGRNRKVRLENPTTGKALLSAEGSQAIVSQDGKRMATIGQDGRARICDVETGKLLQVRALPEEKGTEGVRPVMRGFTADGKSLIVQGEVVCVWDFQTGKQKASWSLWRNKVLNEVETRKRTNNLRQQRPRRLGGGNPEKPRGQDDRDLRQDVFKEKISSVAVSPDGSKIAFVVRKHRPPPPKGRPWENFKRLMIMETMTGKLLSQSDVDDDYIWQITFSSDGKRLAAGGTWTVRVWEVGTEKAAWEFTGHRGGVAALAFSRDGKRLASASEDSTVLVWDVSAKP